MPTEGTSGTSAAVPVPTVFGGFAAGDLLLCVVYAVWDDDFDVSTAITPPGGADWVLIDQIDMPYTLANTGDRLAVFYRVSDGTEPATYTFSWGGVAFYVARIQAYRNVDPVTPIGDFNIDLTPNSDPIVAETAIVNTTADDQRIFCAFAARCGVWSIDPSLFQISQSSPTSAIATGINQDIAAGGINGSGLLCVSDEEIPTSGAVSPRSGQATANLSSPDDYGAVFICVINPNPVSP